MMNLQAIPKISEQERIEGLLHAANSPRRRHPNILHNPGAEFNRVINFIMDDSYMQPHLHPGVEKIERICLVRGKVAVLFFDDLGAVINCVVLEKEGLDFVDVPAFAWHTYVMLSKHAITYETMMGKYTPETWKKLAEWAPAESSHACHDYLDGLKTKVNGNIKAL